MRELFSGHESLPSTSTIRSFSDPGLRSEFGFMGLMIWLFENKEQGW